MNSRQLKTKVVIEQRTLSGSGQDDFLQRVATVYIDGEEYRVLAPAKAVGDPIEWLEHCCVRQPSTESFGSEIEAPRSYGILAIKIVKEELERLQRGTIKPVGMNNKDESYYHVRLHCLEAPQIEVKFDLRRAELEKRVLEPYRNRQPIVLGGRTIPVQNLERVEIFESQRQSSQFGEWTAELARQGTQDCFHGEPDVKNVTDELITTPSVAALPQKPDAIELLCFRFHTVAEQLRHRHDNRSTLNVNDEYDVQDLLHALLRIYFDDVRPEEWTPSYAGKSSRMDFLLPEEELVVEVKKTRLGLGAKELGSELIEDIARYRVHPNCKRLICFVYDPEGRVANPRGIERDLSRTSNGFEVKVIITPRG
ncbi:MAG TPA: hypothetical protein VK699_21155 [Terriglobales bacterium]|jgi:hypothetical protein|nr:hypothetical protein [Terriglobales bacterium]